jgi:hypothetical protein
MRLHIGAAFVAAALLAVMSAASAQSASNTAAKLAALQKACAVGVFTPQECAQRRAALMNQSGAGAPSTMSSEANMGGGGMQASQPNVFRDPDGRFSAPVPAGWNTSDNNGTVQFSSGPAWVMLVPSPATSPDQGATDFINQIRGQYRSLDEAQSGRPTIGGHAAVYAVFRGVNGKGEQVALMVAGIQAPGNHVLVFISSAPQAQIDSFGTQFSNTLNGIRFAGDPQ